MLGYERTYAEVDLDAISHNIAAVRRRAAGKKLLCVLKADAYGHGATAIARRLRGVCDFFGVACMEEAVVIPAGGRKVIPTGIAIALPSPDYVALVFARSGLGIKHGIAPANCVGVIDSDYRGEILVGLQNSGDADYVIQPADRIAQLMVTPVVQADVELVDELDETERGAGGFGSTGK